MQTVLETNSLTKRYRGFSALNGLTVHIPKGSIYGFVGRNGAGKTTLIRLICGLQEPTDGDYMLYGVKHGERGIGRCRRRMGAVVESPSVYMDMTAAENIRQQYRVLGVPSDDGIDELLELVGLGDTASKKVKNFSLGMRQRLGIATALSGDPDFLVLDEPINGLDPQGIIEMRELILRLNRERGITVLISSHILDELSRLATHYGFIDGGRMIKEMSAKELEKRCRKCMRIEVSDTRILARVLDSMNAEYCILDEHNADIYADIGVTALVFALDKENCNLVNLRKHDESLESFYMNLVGGGVVRKLLSANFSRLFRDRIFWLSTVLMFALGTGFPFLHYYNNLNYGESLTPDSTSFAFVFCADIAFLCGAAFYRKRIQ